MRKSYNLYQGWSKGIEQITPPNNLNIKSFHIWYKCKITYCNSAPLQTKWKADFFLKLKDHWSLIWFVCVTNSSVAFCKSIHQFFFNWRRRWCRITVGPEGLGATTSDGGWGGVGPPPSPRPPLTLETTAGHHLKAAHLLLACTQIHKHTNTQISNWRIQLHTIL